MLRRVRTFNASRPVWRIAAAAFLFSSLPSTTVAQSSPAGTISGVVLETRDGGPVEHVSVRLQETGLTIATDTSGHFTFSGIPPGTYELYVSVVDFILIKRTVTVAAEQQTDVTIVLAEATGTLSQTVIVTGRAPERPDPEVAAEQTLGRKDLQQLRGLVTNDPLRAIQVLPGVATGDDLRSDFTVRGSAIDRMIFTFEGVSTPLLVHTVQRVFDTGSLAMINGDVLEDASLLYGAYPQRHGNRLGAELDFRMREGSRDRVESRLSVSGTDAAAVAEGPLGSARGGSWLVSIRKSYLDLVIARLDPENDFAFGFTDVQGKLVYDLGARNQLQLAMVAGRSRLDQQVTPNFDLDEVKDGRNASVFAVASWRMLFSDTFAVTHRAAIGTNEYTNVNADSVQLAHGSARDSLYRSDWSYAPRSGLAIEGGGEIRSSSQSAREQHLEFFVPRFQVREAFDARAVASSAYAQLRWAPSSSAVVSGVRVDHRTLTHTTDVSPWIQVSQPVTRRLTIRGGAGLHRQEPAFMQVAGIRGNRDLHPERAYHFDVGIEGQIATRARWQVTAYDREERDVIRLPEAEIRFMGGTLSLPSLTSRFANELSGHARGVELLLQRRSANGFSGWASYALGFSRYRDVQTGETFWGDYDQRHTINLYALYRFNDRYSASGRFRAGSNFPAPGYWESRDGLEFVSDRRNELRVPQYARVDIRANRTFTKRTTRLTLYVEALNALGRDNVRFAQPGVDVRTGRVFGIFDALFPLVPSVGVLVEF